MKVKQKVCSERTILLVVKRKAPGQASCNLSLYLEDCGEEKGRKTGLSVSMESNHRHKAAILGMGGDKENAKPKVVEKPPNV